MMPVPMPICALLILVRSTIAYIPTCPSFVRQCQRRAAATAQFALTSSQQDDAVEVLMFDEDDYVPTTKSFADFMTEMIEIARTKKNDKKAADSAQAVFDKMYMAYMMEDNAALWPNTTIYNILVDIHAFSPSKDGVDKAQHILDRMEDMTVDMIARPDHITYGLLIDGWAERNMPQKAELILNRMEHRFENTADPDVQPTTKIYNKMIKAWVSSHSDEAPEKAEAILKNMTAAYQAGNHAIKPNSKTFSLAMRVVGEKGNHQRVRALYEGMDSLYGTTGDDDFRPVTSVYNELVASVANGEGGAQAAESMLYEMIGWYREGNETLKPNAATFRIVIAAYKGSVDANVAYKTEKLLELQEGFFGGNDDDLKVDTITYNTAIQVIARTRNPEKAAMSHRLLQKMRASTNPESRPNLVTYNNVLSSCAFSSNNPDAAKGAFRIALDVFNELIDSKNMVPDVTTYGYLLKCCNTLLPSNAKKDEIIERIFAKCCKDGQVGRFVLTNLMEASSQELATKLLRGDPQGKLKIPRGWSKNVNNKRERLR